MDGYGETLLLAGVPVAVLTALVVEALKRVGLAAQWAPWAAVGVAMALAGLAEALLHFSWLAPAARVVVGGLTLGLASSGGYAWARQVGKVE
jgi:hypothetical protein